MVGVKVYRTVNRMGKLKETVWGLQLVMTTAETKVSGRVVQKDYKKVARSGSNWGVHWVSRTALLMVADLVDSRVVVRVDCWAWK